MILKIELEITDEAKLRAFFLSLAGADSVNYKVVDLEKPVEEKPTKTRRNQVKKEKTNPQEKPVQETTIALDLLKTKAHEIIKEKGAEYKDKIRSEINRLGSKSLSELDEANYQELYDFLEAL